MARTRFTPARFSRGRRPRGGLARAVRTAINALLIGVSGLVVLPGAADAVFGIARASGAEGSTCSIFRVVDGDTVGLWCPGRGAANARLRGFDTPEIFSPACPAEWIAGLRAKWALRTAIWGAGSIALVREGTDRYDRPLVAAFIDGAPVARRMIVSGHARPYGGGERQGWCS